MLNDETIELLRETPGQRFKFANDPPRYDILSNNVYLNKF